MAVFGVVAGGRWPVAGGRRAAWPSLAWWPVAGGQWPARTCVRWPVASASNDVWQELSNIELAMRRNLFPLKLVVKAVLPHALVIPSVML